MWKCGTGCFTCCHPATSPPWRHVLATLSAIVLALCEGRTGLAISGVFGASKTRSAAVLLAGLLVFDPSLKLMVLTKENIAAHAVAEHLVSLQMPDYIQEKMGRLVGYYEQNRKGSYTPLDILPSRKLRLCHRSCSWAVLAWALRRLPSMSIYRDTACCLCHLVDGSTWRKRRPSWDWCCRAVQGSLRLRIKR